MKKTFLFLFLLINVVCIAQNDTLSDTSMIFGKIVSDRAYLHNLPESYSRTSSFINSNEPVFIFSYEESASKEGFYGVFKDTLRGYLNEK
ncbi:MAG: hypothetical protein REI96_20705, partial [Flavobacterium nitrogenifigens]|uniref:hypothetical protein n=1 Tax=Flavobacterium nitrogenifigens TaxID=1617283 RepID=UPI002809487A